MTFLDTHVVVWLYAGRDDLLSSDAARAVDENDLFISPIVVLEVEYLREIGRLTVGGEEVTTALAAERDVRRDGEPFGSVVRHALSATWTRDPFDRLIVGHTLARGAVLVTKDELIRTNLRDAIW